MMSQLKLWACALALALATGTAHADTVLATNAVSGWTVTRYTGPGASYNTATYSVDPTVNNIAAVLVDITQWPASDFWTAQNNPTLAASNAKWISSNTNSGAGSSDPNFTKYVYNGSFTLPSASDLAFTFAADNFVDKLVLSTGANGTGTILTTWTNTTVPLGDPTTNGAGKVWGFTLANVQSLLTSGNGTIFITADTYNFDTALSPPYNPGPNGFIMAVNTAPVPLPAAMWGGLSLFAGLGVIRRVRRK